MMEMTITFPGGKKVDAEVRGHVVRTDQSTYGGGDDSAPAPYELFLASLGTCAGIYVLGFCESRGLSTEGVRLVQRHHFDPMTRGLAKVSIDVEVPPDFPEKYHDALVRVANQCAVKKTLLNPPEIEVNTVVTGESTAAVG